MNFSLGCLCFGVTLGIWWDSRDIYALREQKNLHYLLSYQIKSPLAASNTNVKECGSGHTPHLHKSNSAGQRIRIPVFRIARP